MRTIAFLALTLFVIAPVTAQSTLVKGAPNQTFQLDCPRCSITVDEVAIWKGIRFLPYHKERSGLVNLLYWKYYDSIMKEYVTTSEELPWEKCTQLLDPLADTDTISLQINLTWTDSTTQTHRIYLLIGGFQKSELAALPLYSELEAGAEEPGLRRFSAIVQINSTDADGPSETYETLSGEMALENFNPKTRALYGTFEFEGNCIGWVKRGIFLGGVFERK